MYIFRKGRKRKRKEERKRCDSRKMKMIHVGKIDVEVTCLKIQ